MPLEHVLSALEPKLPYESFVLFYCARIFSPPAILFIRVDSNTALAAISTTHIKLIKKMEFYPRMTIHEYFNTNIRSPIILGE